MATTTTPSPFLALLGSLKSTAADVVLKLLAANAPVTATLLQSEFARLVKNPTPAMLQQIAKSSADIAAVIQDTLNVLDLIDLHNATQP